VLDADCLLCVVQHVAKYHPSDLLPTALACKQLLSVCARDDLPNKEERKLHTSLVWTEQDWHSMATATMRRLEWAQAELKYKVVYGTLNAVALRGDVRMFEHVNVEKDVLEMSTTYRFAGRSGNDNMIDHMVKLYQTHEPGALYKRQLLYGIADMDHADCLSRLLSRADIFCEYLIHHCIIVGSEASLRVALLRFCNTYGTCCVRMMRWMLRFLRVACECGRVGILTCLLEWIVGNHTGQGLSDAAKAVLLQDCLLFDDSSEENYNRALEWSHLRPVRRADVLRHLVETMGVRVDWELMAKSVIRCGDTESITYLRECVPSHMADHRGVLWTPIMWAHALSRHSDFRVAEHMLTLGPCLPDPATIATMTLTIAECGFFSSADKHKDAIRVLKWLRDRGVPWAT